MSCGATQKNLNEEEYLHIWLYKKGTFSYFFIWNFLHKIIETNYVHIIKQKFIKEITQKLH